MAGITLAQAQAQLDAWLAASTALTSSQSYRIDTANGTRMLTRADAAEVRQQIQFWDAKVKALSRSTSGKSRMRYLTR